ncbi:MAG: dTDP-4-dehydrorhamnose reductase, partial [Anaerolineae bacterium]
YDITAYPAIVDSIVAFQPDLVVHGAAYTNVDGCARDPDLAYRVNGLGTQNVALACLRAGCPLVYISTNEVFDGRAERAYLETDTPNPINPYGRSKLMGETYVRELLPQHYIVRIAWLFGPGGNNFPAKMLSLARERGQLSVVTDEVSTPTYAPDLAEAVAALVRTGRFGTYHLVNEGICSRHEFARATLDLAGLQSVPVRPMLLKDFVRASTPPPYAPLRNFAAAEGVGIRLRPWQEALADYLSHES